MPYFAECKTSQRSIVDFVCSAHVLQLFRCGCFNVCPKACSQQDHNVARRGWAEKEGRATRASLVVWGQRGKSSVRWLHKLMQQLHGEPLKPWLNASRCCHQLQQQQQWLPKKLVERKQSYRMWSTAKCHSNKSVEKQAEPSAENNWLKNATTIAPNSLHWPVFSSVLNTLSIFCSFCTSRHSVCSCSCCFHFHLCKISRCCCSSQYASVITASKCRCRKRSQTHKFSTQQTHTQRHTLAISL